MRAIVVLFALATTAAFAVACGGPSPPPLVPAPEPAPGPPEPAASSASAEKEPPPDVKRCPITKKCPKLAIDKSATVTLERTACYGPCPVYSVTIRADGLVKWTGTHHVEHEGEETRRIAPVLAKAVLEFAAASCFFGMDDEYEYAVTDHAHAITTMITSGKKKVVRHYVVSDRIIADEGACAPPEDLVSLEAKIDEVAGTRELIGESPKDRRGGRRSKF